MVDQNTPELTRLSPRKRRWRWLFIIPALIVVLLLAAWQGFEAHACSLLNQALAQARAGGMPMTREEVAAYRPRSPEGPNGADIFLAVRPRLSSAWQESSKTPAPMMNDGPDLPPVGFKWSDEQQQAVGDLLARFHKESDALEAMKACAPGTLPWAIAAQPIDDYGVNLCDLKFAAHLRLLHALYSAMEGKTDRVVDDVTVASRLSEMIATYPTLLSAMYKVVEDKCIADTIEHLCGLTTLSPEQLSALSAITEQVEAQDSLWWGLVGERAIFYAVGDDILRTGVSPFKGVRAPGHRPFARAQLRLDMELTIRALNVVIAAGQDPVKRYAALPAYNQQIPGEMRPYQLTANLLPSCDRACVLDLLRRVELRAARAGLAAERFRLDHGQLPDSPEQLVPAYLREIPTDPFGGKPLQFRRMAEGLEFYSTWQDEDLIRARAEAGREPPPNRGFILLLPEKRARPAND